MNVHVLEGSVVKSRNTKACVSLTRSLATRTGQCDSHIVVRLILRARGALRTITVYGRKHSVS